MKKLRITFICCCILVLALMPACTQNTQYLRIHIRANSNSVADQNVKYEIRDKVVEYLTPYLTDVHFKEQAEEILKKHESAVKRLIDGLLAENGFSYSCRISLRGENFPTRVYNEVTLEAGYYDALIIELGEGVGDNWWCVVYPPLCFTSDENVRYRSLIYDIINEFFNK